MFGWLYSYVWLYLLMLEHNVCLVGCILMFGYILMLEHNVCLVGCILMFGYILMLEHNVCLVGCILMLEHQCLKFVYNSSCTFFFLLHVFSCRVFVYVIFLNICFVFFRSFRFFSLMCGRRNF